MSTDAPVRVHEADTTRAGDALSRIRSSFDRQWLDAVDRFHAEDAAIQARGLTGQAAQTARGQAAVRLVSGWHRAIDEALPAAHSVGGRVWPSPGPATGDALAQMVATQKRFASRFAFDLLAGHVDAPGRMRFGARSALYSEAIEGAYQLGAVERSPDGQLIWWRLSTCRHCGDCPTLAAHSPYTRETLPTVPRVAGGTQCGNRCRCYLEFRPAGAAQPSPTPASTPATPSAPAVPTPVPRVDVTVPTPKGTRRTPQPPLVDRATGTGPEPPPGLRRPDERERRVLRDLETRMNRARRAAQRAADAGLDQAALRFLGRRRELNQRLIDFAGQRGIHHVPTWDVGDVITAADVRAGEIDTLTHLRGIDGTTIRRVQAQAIAEALQAAEADLAAVLRDYPAEGDAVPDLEAMLRLAGAPESALGGELTRVGQSAPAIGWNALEALDAATIGPAEGEQIYNVVGRSSAASMLSLLDAVGLLREAGHAVEIGPLDEGWPDLVAAAGWWVRGDGSEVAAFLADLGPVASTRGLEFAPWQGGGA